jgi:hypothetical protein
MHRMRAAEIHGPSVRSLSAGVGILCAVDDHSPNYRLRREAGCDYAEGRFVCAVTAPTVVTAIWRARPDWNTLARTPDPHMLVTRSPSGEL